LVSIYRIWRKMKKIYMIGFMIFVIIGLMLFYFFLFNDDLFGTKNKICIDNGFDGYMGHSLIIPNNVCYKNVDWNKTTGQHIKEYYPFENGR